MKGSRHKCRAIDCTNERPNVNRFCRSCWDRIPDGVRDRLRAGRTRNVILQAYREAITILRAYREGA